MKFLSFGLSVFIALNLMACAESSNRGRPPQVEEQDFEPLLKAVTSIALSDSLVVGSLVFKVEIDSTQIETFVVDNGLNVRECTSEYCTSLRPSSNERFISSATGTFDEFTLDITSRSGPYRDQSIQFKKYRFILDTDFWIPATETVDAHLDDRIEFLQSHYSMSFKDTVTGTIDLAHLVDTKLASVIIDDERIWSPSNPTNEEMSRSILTVASNINLHSRSEYVLEESGAIFAGAHGLESGSVEIFLDNLTKEISSFVVHIYGQNLSSFSIQYDRL